VTHRNPINQPTWEAIVFTTLARYRKAVAAVLAQLPAPTVLGILAIFHVHVDAGTVAAILAAASAILTPAAVATVANHEPVTIAKPTVV
jgi:hypothetical protein